MKSNYSFKNFFGKRTPYQDLNGKNLYEYDRVFVFNDKNEKFAGTVINSNIRNNNFKVILDNCYWSGTTPMFVEMENASIRLIEENEAGYNFYSPVLTLKEFCDSYDWHANVE